jgi:DNA-binding response OmpR family regulator
MTRDSFPIANVVVCDQDEGSLTLICDRLTAEAFEVLPARTVEDAFRLCRYGHPDILILDLGVSEESARELVARVREFDPSMGIVILAPRGVATRRELDADDSLATPFKQEDLRSRLDSVLRRRHRRSGAPVRAGEILIDPGRHKVVVGDREVALARKEFVLLRVLATDPTRVFTKWELLREVWGLRMAPGQTRTLDSHASRLRRKLDPEDGRFVVNCWGVGYSLLPSHAEQMGPLDGQAGIGDRREFGAMLSRLMDAAGLSVGGLAEQTQIDPSVVEMVLAGEHPVRLDEINLLAAALGVPPGRLLLGREEGDSDA